MKKASDFRILVVDDEAEIRDLLSDLLTENGFVVTSAKSGGEALRHVKECAPHLILLDIILPDIDGISVYESLRRDRANGKIPVVFFSTLADNMAASFSREAELAACALIPKPVNTKHLIKEIHRILEFA